jgi:hypothetical protein
VSTADPLDLSAYDVDAVEHALFGAARARLFEDLLVDPSSWYRQDLETGRFETDAGTYEVQILGTHWDGDDTCYAVRWSFAPTANGFEVRGSLTQSGGVFKTPVEIEVRTSLGARHVRLEPHGSTLEFRVGLPAAPDAIVVDPGDWILKRPPRVEGASRLRSPP